jgi:hypothetical protein
VDQSDCSARWWRHITFRTPPAITLLATWYDQETGGLCDLDSKSVPQSAPARADRHKFAKFPALVAHQYQDHHDPSLTYLTFTVARGEPVRLALHVGGVRLKTFGFAKFAEVNARPRHFTSAPVLHAGRRCHCFTE